LRGSKLPAVRLLSIGDNSDIAANLYGFLAPKGDVLDAGANGYAGLGLAAEHHYDLIVPDVMLPGPNGLEICAKRLGELHRA